MSNAKRRLASWEVSEEFWKRVEPLLPVKRRESGRRYVHKLGGGRKPKDPRLVFEAIVYNEEPKPFIWTKSADDILASIKRFCMRTSNSVHWPCVLAP